MFRSGHIPHGVTNYKLAEKLAPTLGPAPVRPDIDAAERRQVTVMFSDLVGSTALSARMDPAYAEALEHCEQVLSVAVTPWDREAATLFKGCALVLLRQAEEGAKLLEGHRSRSVTYGYLYTLTASDPIIGVCKVLHGDIRGGIRFIEEAILKREKEGYQPGFPG